MLERRSPVHPVNQDLVHPLYPQSQDLPLPPCTLLRPLIPLAIIMLWIQVGHLMLKRWPLCPLCLLLCLTLLPLSLPQHTSAHTVPENSFHLTIESFQRVKSLSPLI